MSTGQDSEIIRSSTDGGPSKTRRRFTSRVETFAVKLVYTNTQRQTFDTFFRTTIAGGALSFERDHPVTSTIHSMRIISYPDWVLQMQNAGVALWIADNVQFEILPL